MRLCANGHWSSDACRCRQFWRGESCDLRDCGQYGIRNFSNECECADGYAGEFCEYEICLHGDQWYCNSTRAQVDPLFQERRLCQPELIDHYFLWAANVSAKLVHCDCGYGILTFTESAANGSCVCDVGYYGEFCQWSLCAQGEQWNNVNDTCVSLPQPAANSTRTIHPGFFGYDINAEFSVAAATCVSIIFLFVIIGRLVLKFLKPSEHHEHGPFFNTTRRSTIEQYSDKFHHRLPRMTGKVEKKSSLWKRIFILGRSDRVSRQPATRKRKEDKRKTTTASAGPVLDASNISVISTFPYRERPRSASVQLATVFEGQEINRPRSTKDDDDFEDEVQEQKYRESMINFARQISSDMSVGSDQ